MKNNQFNAPNTKRDIILQSQPCREYESFAFAIARKYLNARNGFYSSVMETQDILDELEREGILARDGDKYYRVRNTAVIRGSWRKRTNERLQLVPGQIGGTHWTHQATA